MSTKKQRIYLYDTTLRDGAQTYGVDFSIQDKINIIKKLDQFGISSIEAGWPGANDLDSKLFESLPQLKNSDIYAFCMTRKKGHSSSNDLGLNFLVNNNIKNVTIVGKAWDFHVTNALNTTLEENLKMIEDSIKYLSKNHCNIIFDAEHFFDGYKANPEYAKKIIITAFKNGAKYITLCDTNGGMLPFEIEEIINKITPFVNPENLSIHCHNDTGNAVANTIAAIRSGVHHIQGTINGLGERCGNANLTTLIPILMLKMNYDVGISEAKLKELTHLSNFLYDTLNLHPRKNSPFVGSSAFAHKGGLHVSAILKSSKSYEHIEPDLVGNKRKILVSNQSGKSNLIARLNELKIPISNNIDEIDSLLSKVKQLEVKGYSFDTADASFALLAAKHFNILPNIFHIESYRCINEKIHNNNSDESKTLSEAVVKIILNQKKIMSVAEGNGPVDALYNALRKTLINHYPDLDRIKLTDFKVRILNNAGTLSLIRTIIEYGNYEERWSTIGVSTNLIEASCTALYDGILYFLLKGRLW